MLPLITPFRHYCRRDATYFSMLLPPYALRFCHLMFFACYYAERAAFAAATPMAAATSYAYVTLIRHAPLLHAYATDALRLP